jgi:hypothetical protein
MQIPLRLALPLSRKIALVARAAGDEDQLDATSNRGKLSPANVIQIKSAG